MSVQIRKTAPVLGVIAGALALALAACGGSSPTSAANTGGNQAPGGGNRTGGGAPPGVFGSIAAISGQTLQVQNPQSGQTAVSYDGSTKITNSVAGTLADVTSGACVTVNGTSSGQGQPVSATAVTITQAGSNGCSFGQRPSGSNAPRPSGSNRPRPSGSNGPRPSTGNNPAGGPRAFGAVTAVSATGFTVHSTFGTNATDVTVNVTSATTYTKTVTADPSVLVVGACVAAQGKADDTGAVAATSIEVSKAGPNGCTGGFRGGRGGGFGGGQGTGGNGGGNG